MAHGPGKAIYLHVWGADEGLGRGSLTVSHMGNSREFVAVSAIVSYASFPTELWPF